MIDQFAPLHRKNSSAPEHLKPSNQILNTGSGLFFDFTKGYAPNSEDDQGMFLEQLWKKYLEETEVESQSQKVWLFISSMPDLCRVMSHLSSLLSNLYLTSPKDQTMRPTGIRLK
jgi:hypothetical protein